MYPDKRYLEETEAIDYNNPIRSREELVRNFVDYYTGFSADDVY